MYGFGDPLLSRSDARASGLFTAERAIDGFVGYFEAMQAAITIQWMQYGFYGKEQRIRADLINHTISFIMYQALQDIGLSVQIAKKVAYHIATTTPDSALARTAASILTSNSIFVNALREGSAIRKIIRVGPTAEVPPVRGFVVRALIGIASFTMAGYGSAVLLVNDGLRGFEHLLSGALSGQKLGVPLEQILIPGDDQEIMDLLIVADELADILRELYDWASDFPLLDR